ncbi:MAG: sialidase family protein [Acidobacteriota bacterium]
MKPCLKNIVVLIFYFLIASPFVFAQMPEAKMQMLDSPAATNSAEPNLFAARDGRIYLSWIEKLADSRHALKFSIYEKNQWTMGQTIAEGANWFVNWADFPSLVALDDGTLVAHWLVKSSKDTFAYDVNIARSSDGGKSWSKPFTPHKDATATEHGFVSLLPLSESRAAAIWLDGRKFKSDGHGHDAHTASMNEMTLRYATIGRDGKLSDESEIDGRACECCQTSAAVTSEGLIVAYRDRSNDEVRDISIARFVKGKWTQPKSVYADNWKINGCPVNGPSITASGKRVAVAWFTGVNEQGRVKLAFSDDAGATFKAPVQVDDGRPAGRVEVVLLADGSAFVVWLENTEKQTEIRAKRIEPGGKTSASIIVSATSGARASGFPQIAALKDEIIFAWTDPTQPARVRTAILKVSTAK